MFMMCKTKIKKQEEQQEATIHLYVADTNHKYKHTTVGEEELFFRKQEVTA